MKLRSERSEIIKEYFEDEDIDMGSLNHRFVQTQIVGQLLQDNRFTTIVELSLDVGQADLAQFGLEIKPDKKKLKPDICLSFFKRKGAS
jgi:hypothetical protein